MHALVGYHFSAPADVAATFSATCCDALISALCVLQDEMQTCVCIVPQAGMQSLDAIHFLRHAANVQIDVVMRMAVELVLLRVQPLDAFFSELFVLWEQYNP